MSKIITTEGLPTFTDLLRVNGGCLEDAPECLALFYYSQLCLKAIEQQRTGIQYEGMKDNEYHYVRVYKMVAALYTADVETMVNYWPLVDKQSRLCGLSLVPTEYKYRHVFGHGGLLI